MTFLNHLPDLQKELQTLLDNSSAFVDFRQKRAFRTTTDDAVRTFGGILEQKTALYQNYNEVLYNYHIGSYNLAHLKTLADTFSSFFEAVWDLRQADRTNATGLGWYCGQMFRGSPLVFDMGRMNGHFFTDENRTTAQQTLP